MEQILAIWPVIDSIALIVLAVASFGWRVTKHRQTHIDVTLSSMGSTLQSASTTLAVLQSQLQNHTEQDRSSFHELRADMGARFLDLQRRFYRKEGE